MKANNKRNQINISEASEGRYDLRNLSLRMDMHVFSHVQDRFLNIIPL